jgi:hypothetical protein
MTKIRLGLLLGLCCVSFVSAQNVILNPSFELWLDSLGVRMPFAWYTSEVQDSGSAVRVADPHTGIYALQLNGSDTMAYALTASIGFSGHHYYFSGWCKSNSLIAGSFIITWLNLNQGIVGNPVIVPIYRSTSWQRYTQMLECPDSAIIVNVNVVSLPYISLTVDDITLTDTALSSVEEPKHNRPVSVFKIYPNPAHRQTHIRTDRLDSDVFIFDITGKQVNAEFSRMRNLIRVNTHRLADGIYFVKLRGKDKTEIRKLIVRH